MAIYIIFVHMTGRVLTISIPRSCNMGAQSQVTFQNFDLCPILGPYRVISQSSQQPCETPDCYSKMTGKESDP